MADSPVPARQLYIGGFWVAPIKGQYMDVINPATEQSFAKIPAATSEDVDAAVAAATAAFKSGHWSRTTGAYRAKFLRAIAQKLRDQKPVLAKAETMDCGKPIDEAEWDMDDVATCFDYYAGQAEALDGRNSSGPAIDVGMTEFDVRVRWEALGVVGLITPWNYPLLMAAWKVAPALAAGCCAVLKPSELASLTCLELAAIADEVQLPPGVLNVITGTGPEAGAPLSAHPGLAKVAFTGSAVTGRRVALAAAANLRPSSLELGGKSALIVFEDADVEKAVEWAMFGAFWTNGQICSSTSRLLVHQDVAPAFLEHLKKRAESINVCDPLTPDCRLGPLVNEGQYRKVLGYIEVGVRHGTTRSVSGTAGCCFVGGLAEVFSTAESRPYCCSRTFRCIYIPPPPSDPLVPRPPRAGAVISACPERCRRVAEALECGIVWVNCSQPCFCYAPWGGIKNSGHGRELGEWGLENFLSVKQITKYVSPDIWGWYSPPAQQQQQTQEAPSKL
ncbi:hypothetical protein VOLCADRAFT_73155 [Volvox carteri f. nagariensis]|uniref:Aldehyde dehydrogenase domain-containing protein n=1 Tax=Volvox carteri f. nagariensis TaxID=3068 RepID=D8TLH8_VOLCA|nr:uncharacterized protein VOLCADRAFT_73155 [Volvox carteri f. nagariensis]EFJ51737.1 hypothetical protein VOLCADRAFT_73155 [Volvox carteri f. nagariensis]|eukprot:XP_002947147.1 hypothetical protein VOLCADRAFT_73155 [Volvox carteri f. nagariensis]